MRAPTALAAMVIALTVSAPAGAVVTPGELDTSYGVDGFASIDWIVADVGIPGFASSPDGRSLLDVAPDPDVGAFSVVSADGSTVVTVDLPGPGVGAFGAGSALLSAYVEAGVTHVARYDESGVTDTSFGTAGVAEVPADGSTFPSALVGDGSAIIVGGGTFDLDALDAWVARLDATGVLDANFDGDGIVEVVSTSSPDSDFVMVEGVHVTNDGYVAVALTRGVAEDAITVRGIASDGTLGTPTEFTYTDELVAVASTQMADGAVIVGSHTTNAGTDTFHLYRFESDGSQDAGFTDPAMEATDVGGRMRLAALRTGEVAIGYNNDGPDALYFVNLVDTTGAPAGVFPIPAAERSGIWIYGLAATWHDGGLLLVTDRTPSDPLVPDTVEVAKYRADDSGRFIDDNLSVHEDNIELLAEREITLGCNPPANTEFCPTDSVTRGQMAAFLVRALGLPPTAVDHFGDDDGTIFEDDINRLAEAGITQGCNPPDNTNYCPTDPVSRAQMATFLIRALP